ncbi:cupin domain-containing protein [Roseibium aggregatum]|uniref:cupin domain-containing protein n=1 Tax=Roseibium aggregatum TaxID=187304 RepID=UPI001A90728C|nr:cupin domain-containing protein [Roseibium aggregatum]MBN8183801.1 cupin domain-containing protein [Roseibium aggregatum]
MQVTRIDSAQQYEAPEHYAMACLRLQGKEATSTHSMWVGLSHLLPGGHTSLKASPQEKIYVVISGQVTITNGNEVVTLGPLDSCVLSPNEPRALENRTNQPATVLLAMEETAQSL